MKKTQKCNTCGVEKPYEDFNKDPQNRLGLKTQCKKCQAEYSKEYGVKNRNSILEQKKIYYADNKPQVLERVKIYRDTHKEEINAYKKTRWKNDPLFRRCQNLSRGLNYHRISIGSSKNGQHTFDILGYSKEIFNNRLDTYLDKPCQRCENIIIANDNSDMDHIIPIVLGKTNDEQNRLFHWTNLRLICSPCNASKGCRLDFDNAIVNPELFDEFVKPLLEEQGK